MTMSFDLESLSLTEIIRLQNQLSALLVRRFERSLALAFSDIVGSTAYFAKHGDEAGRRIQQRHVDLLADALSETDGMVAETSGDGALMTFSRVESAADSLIRFHRALARYMKAVSTEQRWTVRTSLHWGLVITDGRMLAGDAVNLCAKLVATARPGEIRLTKQAFGELSTHLRVQCRHLPAITIPGISEHLEVFELPWSAMASCPDHIVVEETGERLNIPEKCVISCGRLREFNGEPANDLVLGLPDPQHSQQISRWHFELRREPEGLLFHCVSDQPTQVNGKVLHKGDEAVIEVGTVVRISNVMTLRFLSDPYGPRVGEDTRPCPRPL
jgi:class 3 adenylate cyclase